MLFVLVSLVKRGFAELQRVEGMCSAGERWPRSDNCTCHCRVGCSACGVESRVSTLAGEFWSPRREQSGSTSPSASTMTSRASRRQLPPPKTRQAGAMLTYSSQSAAPRCRKQVRFLSTTVRAALEKRKAGGLAPEQALRGEQEELCKDTASSSAEELHMCTHSTPTRPGIDQACSYTYKRMLRRRLVCLCRRSYRPSEAGRPPGGAALT